MKARIYSLYLLPTVCVATVVYGSSYSTTRMTLFHLDTFQSDIFIFLLKCDTLPPTPYLCLCVDCV